MKHFLNLIDLSGDELAGILAEAARLKAARERGIPTRPLAGKVVGLVFEKPSLRTRVSFEAGLAQLGGTSLYLPGNEVGLGWRESHADFARTIGQYIDALVLRVFRHDTLEGVAKASSIPIINGLSDWSHPCQALADMLTHLDHLNQYLILGFLHLSGCLLCLQQHELKTTFFCRYFLIIGAKRNFFFFE